MTLPKYKTSSSQGHLNKFIIIGEREIINLINISYIDIVHWDAVPLAKTLRFVMNDGYIFEIQCNDIEEAEQIIFDIRYAILYDKDKNIIEIIPDKIKSTQETLEAGKFNT